MIEDSVCLFNLKEKRPMGKLQHLPDQWCNLITQYKTDIHISRAGSTLLQPKIEWLSILSLLENAVFLTFNISISLHITNTIHVWSSVQNYAFCFICVFVHSLHTNQPDKTIWAIVDEICFTCIFPYKSKCLPWTRCQLKKQFNTTWKSCFCWVYLMVCQYTTTLRSTSQVQPQGAENCFLPGNKLLISLVL